MRCGMLVGGLAVLVGAAGCGASSTQGDHTTSTAPSVAAPLSGFGATTLAWDEHDQGHQYSAVTSMGGRVISYHVNWPEGTTLAEAEQFILGQLPPDSKLIAKFARKTADDQGSCLMLNYQSPTLAALLGAAPFDDPLGAIGAYLETISSGGTVAPLMSGNVDFGGISLGWNRGTDPC
jgi:hypothetical protein